jgi:hypothetical protein
MSPSAQAAAPAPALQQPRLHGHIRAACRLRHYSLRHPLEMGAAQINQFLTHLAVNRHVSASTQNQAFAALLFLYQKVLEVEPGQLAGFRASLSARPARQLILGVRRCRATRGGMEIPQEPNRHLREPVQR